MLSAFLASIAMFAFVASHGHGALELVNADRATEAALRRATVFNAHTGQGPSQESPTAETETVASPTTPPTRLAASEQGECARRLHTTFFVYFFPVFFFPPHMFADERAQRALHFSLTQCKRIFPTIQTRIAIAALVVL